MESTSQVNRVNLKKVFQSFDKDNNGFIDVTEISAAAKELGIDATDSDIKEIFDKIDKNHDGQINFEEFSAWFTVAGGSKKFGLFRLKALNLAKKAKAKGLLAAFGEGANTHEIAIRLGDTENLNTKLKFQFTYGNQSNDLFKPYADAFEYPEGTNAIVLKFHSTNPETAKNGLKDLVTNALEFAQAAIPGADTILGSIDLKYHHDENHIYLGITTTFPLVQNTIHGVSDVISQFVNEEHGSNSVFEFGLKHDFTTLKNSEGGFLEQLIAGVLFDLKVTLDKGIVPTLRNNVLGGYEGAENIPKPLKRLLLLTLLQDSKVELNIKNPTQDDLLNFIPPELSQILFANFNDLLSQAKLMQPAAILENLPILPQVVEFIKENLQANFTFVAKTPKGLVTVHFKSSGIKEVVEFVLAA